MFDAIWQPDMFIATEKYSDFHEVTVRNQMVHIYPNGIIQYSASLTSSTTYNCDREYYGIMYPCIGVKFILEREYSYYLIQIYLPSILIVILSWVNFWIDCKSVPGRISLALLTAIDVWMAACLAFVFLGLAEFAYVNVQSRVTESDITSNESEKKSNTKLGRLNAYLPCLWPEGIDRAHATDRMSRVVFPLVFIIFNISYWIFLFLWSPGFMEGL
ncbi:GLRA1-like protein [Mya arenaria]|uniref:GLRA1-like protein n=1 Tax=Mya arenaria TaxID=6604 RepID=A0ABY7DS80_MYAAR|nr:GLRA1-like protein [Mya arenaria]